MPKTKEDEAYAKLKTMILGDELPAGEFLSQRMLASKVKAAVVTVRGGLRRLENEGLIESIPKWGVRIPEETEQSLRDRYFMREVLEAAAVERIREIKRPEHKGMLLRTAKKSDVLKGKTKKVIHEYAEAHHEFHLLIAKCSESDLLYESLKRINLRTMMLWNAKRGWGRGLDQNTGHHAKLVRDIFSSNKQKALQAVREHVRRGLKFELQVLGNEE
jgi:DNA-binding GntR family transcriptional regulator